MKVYWKYYIIPFLYGIIFSWKENINGIEKIDICEMVSYLGNGSVTQCNLESVLEIVSRNFMYYVFIIIFSTYIYRHFCNSSVYIFSRCEKRFNWYLKECFKLLGFTFLGNVIMLLGFILTATIGCGMTISKGSLEIVLLYLLIYTFWVFASVLIANIISIRMNSVIGNVITLGLLFFGTVMLGRVNFENYDYLEYIKLRCNPISYTILNWYKVKKDGALWFGTSDYACAPVFGVIILGLCSFVIFLIGAGIIQNMEILDNNTDN